jgi:hypothetical protein
MVFDFTAHALEEMAIHSVTEDDVRMVVEQARACRAQRARSCRWFRFTRTTVTVIFEGSPRSGVLVITVWRSRR